jgi:hypothetical protein
MVQMLVLGGLGLAALATVIWAGWPLALIGRRRRTELGDGYRTWPTRIIAATVLAVVVAISVGALWPADDAAKPFAGVMAFLFLSIGLAIWCLAALVAHRDTAAQIAREAVADLDLPAASGYRAASTYPGAAVAAATRSEPGILFDGIAVLAMVLTVAITGGVLFNILNPAPPEQAAPSATPIATTNPVDGVLADFNTLHSVSTHLDAVPEGALVIDPWGYAVVDVDAELPYVVWHQSHGYGEGLSDSDIVLRVAGLSCNVIGMIVVETDTTISIGLVVTAPASTPTPTPTAPAATAPGTSPAADPQASPTPTPIAASGMTCHKANLILVDWFPVQLTAPLGDRRLQTLDGSGIHEDRD